MLKKYTLIFFILASVSGCIAKSKIKITLMNGKQVDTVNNFSVANVQVVNHQIIITGVNLNSVSDFQIKEGATTTDLEIESASNTSIVANTLSNVSFAAGKVFDFILSNANGASTFTVNFSLCDSTLGGKGFNCIMVPNDKDVLSYDALTDKWIPRNVNGLNYKATFDASPGVDPGGAPMAGDYYIISVAGTINTVSYAVGDWIVYNSDDLEWQKVSNSKDVISVFGRTGKISAKEGDYNLTKMSDVDLTTVAPVLDQILKFNGTNWVPATLAAPAAAVGTAGAPGYSFSGNPNTGFYRPAANQIGITNNGVESVRIDNLGRVGIGVSSPSKKLEVNAYDSDGFEVGIDLGTDQNFGSLVANGSYIDNWGVYSPNTINSLYGSKSEVYQGRSGTVGSGYGYYGYYGAVGSAGVTTNAYGGQFVLYATAGANRITNGYGVHTQMTGNAGNVTNGYGFYVGSLVAATNKWSFYASDATAPSYFAGNVGIGTTGPGSALDVKGTLRLSGATSGYVGFSPPAIAGSTTYTLPSAPGTNGQVLTTNAANVLSWTSVGGIPAGTSGGIPYYDSATTTASSGVLTLYGLLIGGGAGGAPSSIGVGTAGQFLKSAGVAAPSFANINLTDLKSTVAGNLFPGAGCAAGETLTYALVVDAFSCVTGNVIVGTQTNRTIENVNRGQLAQSSTYTQTINADATVNWNNGNLQEINTFVCDGDHVITFTNTKDGAAYSLLLSGAAAHTGICTFSAAGYNFNTSGGALAPVTGKNVLFTFAVIGGTIVYSMMDDLQ